MEPAFKPTVNRGLWEAVAEAAGRASFADSYLWGAALVGNSLLPRTQTAFLCLRDSKPVMTVLAARGIELVKPAAFGTRDGSRLKSDALMPFDGWDDDY